MGTALGWIAIVLAGTASAPASERASAQITYVVTVTEVDGLGWRESVLPSLKPVTRQGAATVWTVPQGAMAKVIDEITARHAGTVLRAPRVTSFDGAAATFFSRQNQQFVTQVASNGDAPTPSAAPETVRTGWHTTMIGRKLDQGVLARIVIEDTSIRAIHHVKVARAAVSTGLQSATATQATSICQLVAAVEAAPVGLSIIPSTAAAAAACTGDDSASSETVCCGSDDLATKDCGVRQASLDVPEIANQEVAGEWLIPSGEVLVISFGAYTAADADGRAVVKERLAVIDAQAVTAVAVAMPAGVPMPVTGPSGAPTAATTPYIVNPAYDAPTPATGPYGAPTAATVPHMPTPETGPSFAPTGATSIYGTPAPLAAPTVAPPAPVAPSLAPAPSAAVPAPSGAFPAPMPALPSRSFPQGVHADGTPADLPPLPADEMDNDPASESESAEPRPSPQTKKPKQAKPAADTGANRADYSQAKPATMSFPSFLLPGPATGLQFLLPLKPLSFKLPMGQKLEIEIYGRVVPNTEAAVKAVDCTKSAG